MGFSVSSRQTPGAAGCLRRGAADAAGAERGPGLPSDERAGIPDRLGRGENQWPGLAGHGLFKIQIGEPQ